MQRTVPRLLRPVPLAVLAYLVALGLEGWSFARLIASSTNSIGYLFLPFVAAIAALPWAVVGATAGALIRAAARPTRRWVRQAAFGSALSLGIVGWKVSSVLHTQALIVQVAAIEEMDAEALHGSVIRGELDKYGLGAVAQNPRTEARTLAAIAALPDEALHRRMGHDPRIMGDNRKGLAVMRLVARHRNVTPAILTTLASSPDGYVRGEVAGNRRHRSPCWCSCTGSAARTPTSPSGA